MKIIDFSFRLPQHPVVLELQLYCKNLILSGDETCIANLFDMKKRIQAQAELISLNYPFSECAELRYEVKSSMTVEVFNLIHQGEIYISMTSRKKEFRLAFKDVDNSRYN